MSFMKLWRQFYSESFQNNFLVLLSPLFLILLILHYELLSILPQSLLLLLELNRLISSLVAFRAESGNGRPLSVWVTWDTLFCFPGDAKGHEQCLWMVISPSVLLCTTQAWYPGGHGVTRLRKPECLGVSQDRQKWGWAFLILTSTWILLIYPEGGFLKMEPMRQPWCDDRWSFLGPGEPQQKRGWWTGK